GADGPAEVGDERQLGGRRGVAAVVGELQGQDREGDADDQLAGHLRFGPQAQRPPFDDLDVVVEEADQAHADHEAQHQQTGERRPGVGLLVQVAGDHLGQEVGDDRRQDEGDTTHGRRTALAGVLARAVVTDVLAVSLAGQQLDQQRGADQRQEEANDSREQDLLHHRAATSPSAPVPSSACATLSSPTERDAFTSTTSPGRNWLRNRSTAACASDTCTDSSPHEPSLYAPSCSQAASLPPTATSLLTLSRTASRPTASCSASASSPSSAILPSTAHVRPPAAREALPIAARARRAARMDSGFAL